MRKVLSLILLIVVIILITTKYGKEAEASVSRWINFSFCDRPIKYTINTVDPKFGLTKAQFATAVTQATQIWDKVIGENLFEQNDNGSLQINLVYDGRQKIVSTINQLNTTVEQQKAQITSRSQQYDDEKAQLEEQIKKLNQEIDYWNSKGGAPKDEYDKLVKEQQDLQDKISQLNGFAGQINQNVNQINDQVHNLNANVNAFNSIIKVNPEEGVYTSGVNRIDIFFYGSQDELIHVLAHELGHSLGLAHVEEQNAIMNPITSANLVPTEADKNSLITLCAKKNRLDLIKSDIQNEIYTLLSKLPSNAQQ